MAGKKNPEVQARRARAVRLEAGGLDSFEIAKEMKVAPSTVRKWLSKARGRKPTKSSRALELAKQGLTRAQIERTLGIDKSTLSRAIKRSTGSSRAIVRAEDRVLLFVERRELSAEYTWQKSFPLALLGFTTKAIEKDAKAGLEVASIARDLFTLQLEKARSQARMRRCNYVAAINLEGMAFQLLDSSQDAEGRIALALSEHQGCEECRAEIELQSGWLRIHQMHAAEQTVERQRLEKRSDEHFSRALELYRQFDGPGHSIAKNGIAASLYGVAALRHYTRQPELALEASANSLQALRKESQLDTRFALIVAHFHANCLASLGGEANLETARREILRVVDAIKRDKDDGELSMVEAKVLWALGLIESALGDRSAEGHLLEALSILHSLEYGREVAVLVTDIMKVLKSDPDAEKKVKRVISAVCPVEEKTKRAKPPKYLQPYVSYCIKVWDAICENASPAHLNALLARARAALDADEVMPVFSV